MVKLLIRLGLTQELNADDVKPVERPWQRIIIMPAFAAIGVCIESVHHPQLMLAACVAVGMFLGSVIIEYWPVLGKRARTKDPM